MGEQENQDVSSDLQETLDLVLRRPVMVGNSTFEHVVLREPTAGELEEASRAPTGVGSLMSLIAKVAGVPLSVPQAMLSRDLARADEFFNTFSVPAPDIGDGSDFVDETTIPLRKPVSIGKGDNALTFSEIDLVEPTGAQKDKAAREPNDTRAAITLISTVAKVPRLAVERMCRRDFEEACHFLASCNVAGPTTGAKSQPS